MRIDAYRLTNVSSSTSSLKPIAGLSGLSGSWVWAWGGWIYLRICQNLLICFIYAQTYRWGSWELYMAIVSSGKWDYLRRPTLTKEKCSGEWLCGLSWLSVATGIPSDSDAEIMSVFEYIKCDRYDRYIQLGADSNSGCHLGSGL